jgi:hypothetical protein
MRTFILYADGHNNYIYIYHSIDDFFKVNPPCKECLVNSMCITDIRKMVVGIQIKSCSLLKEFIRKEQKKFNHI